MRLRSTRGKRRTHWISAHVWFTPLAMPRVSGAGGAHRSRLTLFRPDRAAAHEGGLIDIAEKVVHVPTFQPIAHINDWNPCCFAQAAAVPWRDLPSAQPQLYGFPKQLHELGSAVRLPLAPEGRFL